MGCSRPRLLATEKNVGSLKICKLADVKLDEVAALLHEQRLRLGPSTPAARQGDAAKKREALLTALKSYPDDPHRSTVI